MNRLSRQIAEQAPTFDWARDQITRHAPMRPTVRALDVCNAASSRLVLAAPAEVLEASACIKARRGSKLRAGQPDVVAASSRSASRDSTLEVASSRKSGAHASSSQSS